MKTTKINQIKTRTQPTMTKNQWMKTNYRIQNESLEITNEIKLDYNDNHKFIKI